MSPVAGPDGWVGQEVASQGREKKKQAQASFPEIKKARGESRRVFMHRNCPQFVGGDRRGQFGSVGKVDLADLRLLMFDCIDRGVGLSEKW